MIFWGSKAKNPGVSELGSWRQWLLDGFEVDAILGPQCLLQFHREPGQGGAPPPGTAKFMESPHQVHVRKGQSVGTVAMCPLVTKKDRATSEVCCAVLGSSSQAALRGARQAAAAEANHDWKDWPMKLSCGGPF